MKIVVNILLLLTMFCRQGLSQDSSLVSRERITKLYKDLYLSSAIDTILWNGNINKCECGQLNNSIYTKAQNRMNFFRLVNRLNEVKINPKMSKDAQNAALLIKANNLLTHAPANNLKCFSQSAADGCRKSCLGFADWKNFAANSFITGFVLDYGDDNYFVGHRRWILYSRLKEFGYGATNTSEALLTVDGVSYDSIKAPEFIAYPWHGYVPVELIFPKWSFSIPDSKKVDFSHAKVYMTDATGKPIAIQLLQERKDFLDHTLVWTARGLFTEDEVLYCKNTLSDKGYLEKKITVQIKNVMVDGKRRDFSYFVQPIRIKE